MTACDPDWWKTLFHDVYLITDARSVCDHTLTSREVDFIEEILKPDKSWPVLDLCGGQGRHALELSRRGFQNVTVLDYSEYLIHSGQKTARDEGLNMYFVKKDARYTGLPAGSFRVILLMASSFGYFIEENENEKILREVSRLLMRDGVFLLDIPNRELVVKNFVPRSWHEANEDVVVCRDRQLEGDIIYSREMVLSKKRGLIRDKCYCTRLYTDEKMMSLLKTAGFHSVNIHTGFVSHDMEGDYGCLANRMIVIAKKL
ncbi:MAG: class I SAM-dependent methyltransferase [Deltaproteobacteria bacterium]|nr:class I SAM-dependent methyltransferase [Deltaproteobacteria bacterium]